MRVKILKEIYPVALSVFLFMAWGLLGASTSRPTDMTPKESSLPYRPNYSEDSCDKKLPTVFAKNYCSEPETNKLVSGLSRKPH